MHTLREEYFNLRYKLSHFCIFNIDRSSPGKDNSGISSAEIRPPWNAGWGFGFLSVNITSQPNTNVTKVSLSLLLVGIKVILFQTFSSFCAQPVKKLISAFNPGTNSDCINWPYLAGEFTGDLSKMFGNSKTFILIQSWIQALRWYPECFLEPFPKEKNMSTLKVLVMEFSSKDWFWQLKKFVCLCYDS